MAQFNEFESTWPRREHFNHYLNTVRCTYSLTVDIEITALYTALKEIGLRAYPAQIYMLAAAVNRFPALRMGLTEDSQPGFWEVVNPAYTIFNKNTKTFSCIYTEYNENFNAFYTACAKDIAEYSNATKPFPKDNMPKNLFDISSIPWVDFSAFNLNIYSEGSHLLPIFTLGKYKTGGGKTILPLAMQLHHAACDGYHAGQFIEELRSMAQNFESWLR